MDGHLNPGTVPGEMFVHGVVQDFRDAVMKRPFIGSADVHSRLLSDGFEAFQGADFGAVIDGILSGRLIGHGVADNGPEMARKSSGCILSAPQRGTIGFYKEWGLEGGS
jgi:hypothetical protein